MNALVTMTTPDLSMSSLDIAELTGKRHDNVMADIRKMLVELCQEGGVLNFQDTHRNPQNGQEYPLFRLPKRETLILVSGYNLTMRARIIDRWQELEQQAALGTFRLPKAMSEALRLAADQADRIEALEHKVSEDAPKVAALERFANLEGKHNVRNAAKLLGIRERLFTTWLIAHNWMYRDHGGRLCVMSWKQADGCLDTTPVEIRRSDTTEIVTQPRITQKGLTRLAVLLARDGLIPKEAA